MFKWMFSLSLVVIVNLYYSLSYACTTIFNNNNGLAMVVARSVDLFTSDQPLIVLKPRGQQRYGEAGANSLSWKSKYGSLVVTAFHSNAVTDGMNEKGLAVHLLYLSGTQYPKPDSSKPVISNLLWSQYILDNFSSVAEALKGSKDLQIIATRLHNQTWPIHLTMEDPSGDSAIVEFINGKLQVHHGKQYQIMTNEPEYALQIANLKRYQGFGGELPLPGDPDPMSRFVRASSFLLTLPKPNNQLESVAGVFSVMRTVMVPFGAVDTSGNKTEDAWPTRWVSVADMTNRLYYFNSTTAPNIIWFDLNKMDFTQGARILTIDPTNIRLQGDATKLLN